LALSPAWTAESDQASALFGGSAGTAGDVNGDGYADVIVGAREFTNGQTNEGRAYVYLGSSSGLAMAAAWTVESDQASALLGNSVGTAGDVNGDGYADVIVGTYLYDGGFTDEGRASVYLGSASGLSLTPAWTAGGGQATATLGFSVSTAGDVNGDGYADVIVGAPTYDNGQFDEGRAFVYYGNGGAGLSVRPQQRRADDLAPIAPGGHSRTPGSFRLTSLGRTPFGRGRVKLEWEVKPLNALFTGTGTQRSTNWMDTGTAGAAFNELVSGLDPRAYHWRARLLYQSATTPLQRSSRWFTQPWNGWNETDLTLSAFLGGVVWNDQNADGVRGASEPMLGGVEVDLLNNLGATIGLRLTAADGTYRFELPGPGPFKLRFLTATGYRLTVPDQGTDDTLDSDADPVTLQTALVGPMFGTQDSIRWSAGMRTSGPCIAPDEPIFISNVRPVAGTSYLVLDFQDPNQTERVTGYNVYRSTNPALPPASWTLVGSDVVDEDLATLNEQWVDRSGATPPLGGAFYYQVTSYNDVCGAEGPR
jgi:hypothetical protein